MNEQVREDLQIHYPNLWEQRPGHWHHTEADSECAGEEVSVNNEDGSIDFICCSECGKVREV